MYSLLLISDETFRVLNIPISMEARKELDRILVFLIEAKIEQAHSAQSDVLQLIDILA